MRIKLINPIILVLLLVSSFSKADLVPSLTIEEGNYESQHAYIRNLRIKKRGANYFIEGELSYVKGRLIFPVNAVLRRSTIVNQENSFYGKSSFIQQWDSEDGTCPYNWEVKVEAYKNEKSETVLYVEDYSPVSMYYYLNYSVSEIGCPPATYSWRASQEPFILKRPQSDENR